MNLLITILQNDTIKVLVLDNKSFLDYIKEPSIIIALVAIIISVLGFIYSVRYNRKSLKQSEEYNRKTFDHTIKHNKLSVEPMLYLKTSKLSNSLFTKVILKNGGLGTAIINHCEIIYKGDKYNSFQFVLKEKIIKEEKKFIYTTFGGNTMISANDEVILLEYKAITIDEYYFLNSLLKEIDIQIEYKSIYGEIKYMT
jgi:hypothetical protein